MIKELAQNRMKYQHNQTEGMKIYEEENEILSGLEGRYFRSHNCVFKLKEGKSFSRGVMITIGEKPKIESDGWVTFSEDTVEITLHEFEIEYNKVLDLLHQRIYTHN